MPNLKSLYINLTEEEQVDFLMQTLPDLEFLNGIPVEREDQEDDAENNSFGTDEDFQDQNNSKYNPPNPSIPEIEGDSGSEDNLSRNRHGHHASDASGDTDIERTHQEID